MENILSVTFHNEDVVTKSINTRLGWNGMKCIANKLMNTSDWYFQYKDEEGDSILGSSEAEWKAVEKISERIHKFQLPVDVFPLNYDMSLSDHIKHMTLSNQREDGDTHNGYVYVPESCCKPEVPAKESCCKAEMPAEKSCCKPEVSTEKSCCKPEVSTGKSCCKPEDGGQKDDGVEGQGGCCKKPDDEDLIKCCKKPTAPLCAQEEDPMCSAASGCCTYQRPLPPYPEFDENEVLVKVVNPTLPQQKYTNEALRALACPLGPLGGGCIAIAGDGGLRQWQINNKVNHNAQVPDSFFAIKVGSSAAVLQSSTWYNQTGFKPSAYITDHVVPSESKVLLSQLPGVKTVEVTSKYPVVEVDYMDDKLKDVGIHLEAWSPKIPHNSRESAIPVIIFDFHVTNKGKLPIDVSLLGSLQNVIGWDGYTKIANEVVFSGYGGNANALHTTSTSYGIQMSNTKLGPKDERYGHVAITALTQASDKPSSLLQFQRVKDLWTTFTSLDCLPGQGIPGESAPGTTFNGAVSNKRSIDAGKTTVFTYMISWHIPNRYRDWNTFISIPNTAMWIGTQYAKIWPTIDNVIDHTQNKLAFLRTYTYKFRDSMFNSTLPWQLVDSAAGRVSVLNSPTCLWPYDGYFYAFEGCSNKGGCCPLNCTHVWNYEMTLACLYPDLERTMREIDLLRQITPHGVIPSRTECPLQLERVWNQWVDYSTNPASCLICVDGEIGTVLKTYREIKQGAPKRWYSVMYAPMKLVMKHWLDVLDTEKNGLVYGPQPNTFDVSTYGYMVIWGLLYLCGLRAAEEIAKLMGDKDFAVTCRARFELGTVNLDTQCFTNGKWFTHVVDPKHAVQVLTDCSFVGALYGQWWAHLLGLGYLVPKEHIVSHLKHTYARNYVKSFNPATQHPRPYCDSRDDGWVMGTWDTGIPKNALLYSTEASWSGVLYPFASLMIMEGLKTEGLEVLRVNRYLYDGTRRSPWNEIECGDHYSRPMSSWALFQAASGQNWTILDSGAVELEFNPTICEDNFTGFFALGTCWGTFTQVLNENANSVAKINVEYGSVEIASLSLNISCNSVSVKCDTEVPCQLSTQANGGVRIQFASSVKLEGGKVLSVELS